MTPKCESFHIGNIGLTTNWTTCLKGVDTVIHLAARVHILIDNANNPLQAFRDVNSIGTLNLAQQAVKMGVKRFIYLSSIRVNGDKTTLNLLK